MKKTLFLTTAFVLLLLCSSLIYAQKTNDHDTSYFSSFPQSLTARLFLSQKYGSLYIRAEDAEDLQYKINQKLHLGAGFTYGKLSLNGAIGVGYINNNAKSKGKTTSYDLQLRFFPYKWIIDGALVYNKGYHHNKLIADSNPYRPDIKLAFVGGDIYRIANADKFSYRAAMSQSEWQKRSAGSFLYGANISYGRMTGDSALVPLQLANLYEQAGIKTINFFNVGPGVGYAYTLVAGQHFFIMVSLIGNLNLNITSEQKLSSKTNKVSVMPGAIYKTAIGYNSSTWSLTADLAGNALLIKGKLKDGGYLLPIGIYRLVLARKFDMKRKG